MASVPLLGISSMATRLLLAEIAEASAAAGGPAVRFESTGGVDAARRLRAGEPFDVAVLAADAIDRLGAEGRVVPGSRRDLVRSGVAVAVQAGAPRPAVGSADELRRAVLAARGIGYSTGPSGVALVALLERWGIQDAIRERLVQAPAGVPVGSLVARGEVELGFQQLSELVHVAGVDVVGPLPPEVQITTTFSAAVCASSARPDDVRALIEFMGSPATAPAKRRQGMDPA
jgi:molybdate transport system substrate-binding protein